jgi:hypothetical protein
MKCLHSEQIVYIHITIKYTGGDGNIEDIIVKTNQQHTYLSVRSYTVTISGVFPEVQMVGNVQITSVLHLGGLVNFRKCF